MKRVEGPGTLEDYPPFMREGLREMGWEPSWGKQTTLDKWLAWEGILGYTERILMAVQAIYGQGGK